MTPQDVDHRVRTILASHLDVDVDRLSPETRLGEDLCVDSLTAVELLMVLEDEFDIALPDHETSDLVTYGDLLSVVAERVGATA
ncbi:MAG TPA: phosphopantetheine-binding protein [Acidimicrobiales bacterium]|nr:phosphopantetheine-binding protein [Acidimicrobiales bacterium]